MQREYWNKQEHRSSHCPFEVMGIICESDSGLVNTDQLGVTIGLYPMRHDGYKRKLVI